MPTARVNDIELNYRLEGDGEETIVLVNGLADDLETWGYQVDDFIAAGYRVLRFDNRGIGATENAQGFTTQTMVADTAELIESLGAGPARIVGVSMGSYIAQELMVARPDLVSQAVLMATRGRLDRARDFFRSAEDEFAASGVQLPASYDAKIRLLESFSPKTLSNDEVVAEWIATFNIWPIKLTPGLVCQGKASPQGSRLPAYRSIPTPVLVLAFADDVVTPPHLGKEVGIISGADMFEADLREGVIAAADATLGIRVIETRMRSSEAQGASLVGANLERSKLSGVIALKADFSDAVMKDCKLVRANLKQATMKGANLSGADLSGADLAGADLRDAVLVGAKTLQWNVSNANLTVNLGLRWEYTQPLYEVADRPPGDHPRLSTEPTIWMDITQLVRFSDDVLSGH